MQVLHSVPSGEESFLVSFHSYWNTQRNLAHLLAAFPTFWFSLPRLALIIKQRQTCFQVRSTIVLSWIPDVHTLLFICLIGGENSFTARSKHFQWNSEHHDTCYQCFFLFPALNWWWKIILKYCLTSSACAQNHVILPLCRHHTCSVLCTVFKVLHCLNPTYIKSFDSLHGLDSTCHISHYSHTSIHILLFCASLLTM